MSAKYIFRLDDICPDMNYANFSRIRDMFRKYGIQPIIGVIPHNEDMKLIKQAGDNRVDSELFWKEVKNLQEKYGWSVALHGYNHVYTTDNSGIFKVNRRAEFAGISRDKQDEKIRLGKAILEEYELKIDAFMAPAHSLDWNTVESLKKNGITVITDGKSYCPYEKRGMLFIPQVHSWPRKHGLGLHTVCLHINEWEEQRFVELERLLKDGIANKSIPLTDVSAERQKYSRLLYRFGAGMSWVSIVVDNSLRRMLNGHPRIKRLIKKLLGK